VVDWGQRWAALAFFLLKPCVLYDALYADDHLCCVHRIGGKRKFVEFLDVFFGEGHSDHSNEVSGLGVDIFRCRTTFVDSMCLCLLHSRRITFLICTPSLVQRLVRRSSSARLQRQTTMQAQTGYQGYVKHFTPPLLSTKSC
jgi:hypothetical protein